MQSTLALNVGGESYIFSENAGALDYVKRLYPSMKFESSLSLSNWTAQRNLHQLKVEYPYALDIKFNHPAVSGAVLDAFLNFLDSVQEDMYRNGIKSTTVVLSRIDVGTHVDNIIMKSKVYANLRAVFVPDK